jgi:hypothetical protein
MERETEKAKSLIFREIQRNMICEKIECKEVLSGNALKSLIETPDVTWHIL